MCTVSVTSQRSLLAAGLLLGWVCGCGGDDAPVREYADVTGKISYQGEPLRMGKVMFQPAAGAMVVGDIQADGTYSLKGVVGPNSVLIESRDEVGGSPDANDPASREMPKSLIPPRYSTPGNGLSFDVKAGSNTADFDLQ